MLDLKEKQWINRRFSSRISNRRFDLFEPKCGKKEHGLSGNRSDFPSLRRQPSCALGHRGFSYMNEENEHI